MRACLGTSGSKGAATSVATPRAALCSACTHAPSSQPRPLARPPRPRGVRRRRLHGGERHPALLRRSHGHVEHGQGHDGEEQHRLAALEERKAPRDAPPEDVHRQVRRHAVVDRDQDRRLARAHPGAQPQARLQLASDRSAGQAVAVTAAARRAAGAPVVALALLAVAVATAAAPARAQPADGPVVRAPAAILVEPATGDVVYQRKASDERPVASTTKLMTALLTLERMKLSTTVTAIRYRAAPAESVIGLRAGERLTVADLMRGLLLASANDAAATLAVRVGGTRERFVRLMNRRARQLGLRDTHYANPIGLDEAGNHSSAEDLVKLTLILRRNAFFRAVTNLPGATLRTGSHERMIVNRNVLVRNVPVVNGVKTGHTSTAGYVLVGSATRNGITVVSAVLGEGSESARDADSLALLRYGLSRYRRATAVRRGARYATARLRFRDDRVPLVATHTVRRTVRRGERLTTRVIGAPGEVEGPLPAGARMGTIELRWRGRTIDRVALVTGRAVAGATVTERLGGAIGRTLLVVLAAAVALGSLQLVLLRRRTVRRRRGRAGGTEIA